MNIFLIGMMGSGKSYFAQALAKALDYQAYDLDHEIATHAQSSISELFASKGEAYFRILERDTLAQFTQQQKIVLATGGGTPCFHENMQRMNDAGVTIWLNVAIPTLTNRLSKEKAHRPLISHLAETDLEQFLTQKLVERTPYYRQAKHILTGSQIQLTQILDILAQHAT